MRGTVESICPKFERRIAAERGDAAFEARLVEAVGRGIADIETGRYAASVDEAFERAEEKAHLGRSFDLPTILLRHLSRCLPSTF